MQLAKNTCRVSTVPLRSRFIVIMAVAARPSLSSCFAPASKMFITSRAESTRGRKASIPRFHATNDTKQVSMSSHPTDHPTDFQGSVVDALSEAIERRIPDSRADVSGGGGHFTRLRREEPAGEPAHGLRCDRPPDAGRPSASARG